MENSAWKKLIRECYKNMWCIKDECDDIELKIKRKD